MNQSHRDKFHIVYLGENGFPYGYGAIQKMTLISRALINAGAKVTVLNRKGKFNPDQPISLSPQGVHQGIHYIYATGNIYRPKSFLTRNLQKVKGSWKEFQILRKLKKNKELSGAIISSYSAVQVMLYRFYAWLFDFPIVLNYVEMISSVNHRKGLSTKINDYFLVNFLIPMMDGALPISKLLEEDFKKRAPKKEILKIPIICDFDRFNVSPKKTKIPYYLYCGVIDYREVIDFVIESFELLPMDNPFELHLVTGDSTKAQIKDLQATIAKGKKADRIKIFSNIPGEEIPIRFKGAHALLIPLRPTIQDSARFPHKIGEYLATANPIITTNVGEISQYFSDEKDALIADQFDQEAFAKKMQWVVDHPNDATQIGKNGKTLGLANFNYLSYGNKLRSFLENLNRA